MVPPLTRTHLLTMDDFAKEPYLGVIVLELTLILTGTLQAVVVICKSMDVVLGRFSMKEGIDLWMSDYDTLVS